MFNIYTKPLRVYFLLGALALWGLLSGLQLPVSLFPKSSQIRISARIPYGSLSATQFFEAYGKLTEASLQSLKINGSRVHELQAEYGTSTVRYLIEFDWGADPDQALKDVETKVLAQFATSEEAVRRSISVRSYRQNQGFFAVSFYSPMRSLDDIYKILDPLVTPMSSRVVDAEGIGLFNPNRKEVTVTLIPEKLALFEVNTLEVQTGIQQAVMGLNGGTLKIGEREFQLDLPKTAESREDLGRIRVSRDRSPPVFLKDIAKISIGISKESRQKFKTSGVDSLILFAQPKDGGNIKDMADQVMTELKAVESQWPADIQYKVLVNPSEFINNSINGVVREVFVAAFLAVFVLFCFMGSLKNVITAAIEIPLSLLLAFVLMRLTGMNLNLISLGGLALSAGMNVDASVVVLENIFRHFHGKKASLSYQEKAEILIEAVNEVKLPIIASTVASLVVFTPLVFTRGLTNALLGDLAKAVVFSHGLSALVALILVPTIRLQLLSRGMLQETHSPFEKTLNAIIAAYRRALKWFLLSPKTQTLTMLAVAFSIPALIYFVIPRLDTEVIGKPETDWLIVGVNSPTFTSNKQVEAELEVLEQSLMQKFGEKISYTFAQIQGETDGFVMVRLKTKKDIAELVSQSEEIFKNTATKFYWVDQWNPSELNVPDPPQARLEITGGTPDSRLQMAQDLQAEVLEKGIYDKLNVQPPAQRQKAISIRDFSSFGSHQEVLTKNEISHYLRVATDGLYVDRLYQDQQELPIYLRLENDSVKTLEQVGALPVGYKGRLIPMGALAQLMMEDRTPGAYRENQRDLITLKGTLNKVNKPKAEEKKKLLELAIASFKEATAKSPSKMKPNLTVAVPDKDLQDALVQLKWAIGISIVLIFLTMIIQLGDFVQSLLVLVAIPLGFVGVIVSLWVFNSSLSLNSGLGTILLNGIAVANSIILVDFIQKLFRSGMSALDSTLDAASARLKPILMTSLTTVLGMLPVALGLGDGGKILQPLGIAVCGGLWVSMLLTLFFVPSLQYRYLHFRERRANRSVVVRPSVMVGSTLALAALVFCGSMANAEQSDFTSDLETFREKNLLLGVENEKLRAAEDVLFSRRMFWTPAVSISASKSKTELNRSTLQEIDSAQVDATLNLFRGGADIARMNSADASKIAQSVALKSEQLRSDEIGSELIFKALYLRESLHIQEELFKLKEETIKIVKDRYDQGKSPLQDVTKADVDLVQQKNRVRLAELAIAENEAAIKAVFVEKIKTIQWPFSANEELILTPNTSAEVSKAPRVELKYWTARAKESYWKSVQRQHYPTLDFTFQYQQYPLSQRDNTQTTALLMLKFPLWSKYETAAASATAYAEFQEAQVAHQLTERSVELRNKFLETKIETVRKNLVEAKSNLEKSKALYRDMLGSFRAGRLSTNDLFIEQNRLLESSRGLLDGQLSFHQTIVEACTLQGLPVAACTKSSRL